MGVMMNGNAKYVGPVVRTLIQALVAVLVWIAVDKLNGLDRVVETVQRLDNRLTRVEVKIEESNRRLSRVEAKQDNRR